MPDPTVYPSQNTQTDHSIAWTIQKRLGEIENHRISVDGEDTYPSISKFATTLKDSPQEELDAFKNPSIAITELRILSEDSLKNARRLLDLHWRGKSIYSPKESIYKKVFYEYSLSTIYAQLADHISKQTDPSSSKGIDDFEYTDTRPEAIGLYIADLKRKIPLDDVAEFLDSSPSVLDVLDPEAHWLRTKAFCNMLSKLSKDLPEETDILAKEHEGLVVTTV